MGGGKGGKGGGGGGRGGKGGGAASFQYVRALPKFLQNMGVKHTTVAERKSEVDEGPLQDDEGDLEIKAAALREYIAEHGTDGLTMDSLDPELRKIVLSSSTASADLEKSLNVHAFQSAAAKKKRALEEGGEGGEEKGTDGAEGEGVKKDAAGGGGGGGAPPAKRAKVEKKGGRKGIKAVKGKLSFDDGDEP